MDRRFDLLYRLTDFSVKVKYLGNSFHKWDTEKVLAHQMARAGLSVALNYSEAVAAESRKDFVHKLSLVLKELREVKTCLAFAKAYTTSTKNPDFIFIQEECDELIAIVYTSIRTAKKKLL
jgi:four helix bundle protein